VAFAPETLHFVHEPERDVNQNTHIFKPLFASGLFRNAKYSLRVRIIEEIVSALGYDGPRERGKGRHGMPFAAGIYRYALLSKRFPEGEKCE
jgi:hypothetical protein